MNMDSSSVTRCGDFAPLVSCSGDFLPDTMYCWMFFIENWALFHLNHRVTLAGSQSLLRHALDVDQ